MSVKSKQVDHSLPHSCPACDVGDGELSGFPPVMTTSQLADLLGVTRAALEQDRYTRGGQSIPWTSVGRRVRYLRSDVYRYLVEHRSDGEGG